MTTIKRSSKGRRPKPDRFAEDEVGGEYEKPGPRTDPDAAAIAAAISDIKKRAQTGVVLKWRPPWLAPVNGQAFSLYFFEDKLAIDFINRGQVQGSDMDALADDLSPAQRAEVAAKMKLCAEHGISYICLGPDDELDKVQLAAKLGATSFKKGARPIRQGGGEGFTEEELQ